MTLLAVPITADTTDGAIASVRQAADGGADAVELRLDYLEHVDLEAVFRAIPDGMTVIATPRAPDEGGQWQRDDAGRLEALSHAVRLGPDCVDIELATWRRHADADRGVVAWRSEPPRPGNASTARKLILSSHDFQGRPADLEQRLERIHAADCDVAKIVWRAESICDALTCFDMMRASLQPGGKPVIAIAMGESGLISRILARKFGAFLSFCSLTAGAESAPGQIALPTMRDLYRWDAIGPDSGVYGVIGHPIAHSMSPAIHNAAFAECGLDAVYVPLLIEPAYEAFEAFVRGAMDRPWMNLRGLSVTIPHKENALRFVGDRVEPLAKQIGAVNTLVFDSGGTVRGLNTDYAGALDALTEGMGCRRSDIEGVPVAVIGAGGASRAQVAGLCDCGCDVTIYNRTFRRAESLAEEFGCRAEPLERVERLDADIVINTTSLGMHPNEDTTPLPAEAMRSDMVVFDNVYNPMETRLLREAAEVGCTTVSGVDMFVHQAVAQFEAWTGRPAPQALMRRVVVDALSGRRDS